MLNAALRLFGFEKRSIANPSAAEFALFGAASTAAGVHVSASTCLNSPTCLAAVRYISESIGGLPFHIFRRGADGERERDRTHPVNALLAADANPWTGAAEARTALMVDALTERCGAGYAAVVRLNRQPIEMHRLEPGSVTRDDTGPEPVYRYNRNGVTQVYDWRDIVVVSTPGSTPDRPLSIVHLAREAIGIDIVMAAHQARMFGNGAKPSGVLKHPKTIGPEPAARLKAQFEAAHSGDRSGRTLLLEEGMDFQQTALSSVDAQFLELRRFAVSDIARAFKTPPTLVGDLERGTWSNIEELNRQAVQTCLMPWAEVWQSALERALLTPAERQTHFIEAVFDDLLRADMAARFTAYSTAVGGPWLLPNEARALENRSPVEGGNALIRQAGQTDAAASATPDPAAMIAAA